MRKCRRTRVCGTSNGNVPFYRHCCSSKYVGGFVRLITNYNYVFYVRTTKRQNVNASQHRIASRRNVQLCSLKDKSALNCQSNFQSGKYYYGWIDRKQKIKLHCDERWRKSKKSGTRRHEAWGTSHYRHDVVSGDVNDDAILQFNFSLFAYIISSKSNNAVTKGSLRWPSMAILLVPLFSIRVPIKLHVCKKRYSVFMHFDGTWNMKHFEEHGNLRHHATSYGAHGAGEPPSNGNGVRSDAISEHPI